MRRGNPPYFKCEDKQPNAVFASANQCRPLKRQTNAERKKHIMNFTNMSITFNVFLAVLLTFVVVSAAAYRVTRFLLFDSLIEGSRQRYYVFLGNNSMSNSGNKFKRFLAHKLLELSSCSWCLGVWISAGLYWLWTWTSPLYWGRLGFILVAAIAGFQGLLHAFEPSDDE